MIQGGPKWPALFRWGGAPKWWLHALGLPLVIARIIHPLGISAEQMSSPLRMVGSMATALVTVACALLLCGRQWARASPSSRSSPHHHV